jgi:hypothetical protein
MSNERIALSFIIEKGESVGRYYFSARIKLTDESKNLLHEKLGHSIELDNLGSYFNLNPENFYIYHNPYANRDELYVKDNDGKHLTSNLPLNHYGFSVELSSDGSLIADYGFYPLRAIYNPDNYNKAQEKVFDDGGKLLPTVLDILGNSLKNESNLTTQEIFLHLQIEAAEKEAKLAREKRNAEEELSKKNEELTELIEKGEIVLFKVIKGPDIGNERSSVVLQSENSEKTITLDSNKFYIAKYNDSEFLHCNNSGYDDLFEFDKLFFVLNNSSYPDLESGFYSIPDDSYASYLNAEHHYLSDSQVSEKLESSLERNVNQIDTKAVVNDEPVNEEEVTVESTGKSRKKRSIEEDDDVEQAVHVQTREGARTVEPQVSQELMQNLFPNKEYVVINDKLTIEVKYSGLTIYTPEYIKQTVKDAYGAWSENFYAQRGVHDGPVKLQLYVFKNYDEYKAHIKELSGGKDHKELWGGGTVRAHEGDGVIAKTFIVGDVNGLLCAKSKILMEKMSDAFLEYATGNLDEVPEVLRTGMKLFMWSYDAAKKESTRDMHYTKEAYEKMQESGHDTPYEIATMANDYRMADCLVTFLQETHPKFIKQLLTAISSGGKQAISKFTELLNDSGIEREFKQWMEVKSGNKVAAELTPDNEVIAFGEHKIQIHLKYDNEELSQDKFSSIKGAIHDAIEDFHSAFGINNSQPWHNIPNKVNVFVFNTKSDYEDYLKELGVYDEGHSGLTRQGRGSEVHVYFYLQDQFGDSCKTLKHELGHALTMINSYYGTGNVLPLAMHEGVANYVAGLEDGEHVNDHGDIAALSSIQSKSLKPDEILRDNYQGTHYYSEAEQVIKFLEHKHPDMLDNLLKSLSMHGTNRSQGNKSVEDFLTTLRGYDQEFKGWVADQISSQSSSAHKQRSTDTEQMQADSGTNLQSSDDQKRVKRSTASEKEQEEDVMASVIEGMERSSQTISVEDTKHPLKIKTGSPIEEGKYKVELRVTYDDVTNFYETIKNKYNTGTEYNYEQVMVLYNNVVKPASQHYEKSITLAESYVADGHLFIQNQDFGTLNDFNEMFYKSDEIFG